MAETTTNSATKRYAVVTGANKEIGLEICRQLASKGIKEVLKARNEQRGHEATEELKKSGLSDFVVFHKLDVVDPASIASLADFIKTQFGKLDILCIPSERVKGMLHDIETLTDAKLDKLLNEFLQDFQDGLLESKGWPNHLSAYTLEKSAMNAFTRMLAKKYPNFLINSICPGFVKTDINDNSGNLTAEEGAESIVKLALLPDGGPSGVLHNRNDSSSFEE